jgi:anaerobic magnesium-protoporphyrin IX monomethyl ester cyclase
MSILNEHVYQAKKLYSSGDIAAAIALCSQVLQTHPLDWAVHEILAEILLSEKRQSEAVSHLKMSVQLNPSRSEPLQVLASLGSRPKWRGIKDGALVMGFPCWNPGYPFYSLMVVAGIAKSAGIYAEIGDFNIQFYDSVSETDKALWGDQHAPQWMTGGNIPPPLYLKCKDKFESIIISTASAREYGIFLITVNMSTRYFTEQAIALLKTHFPDVPVILGGVDCFPMEWNRRFFGLKTPPDVICQGESEIALPAFLSEYAATGELPTGVKGFTGFAAGAFFNTGEPVLPNLKETPLPSLNGLDFSKYQQPGDFPIYASRGCVNRCRFCSESPNFKSFRYRPAEHTFAEIQYIYKQAMQYNKTPTIHFADSLINGSISELEKLCKCIIDEKISVIWGGQIFFRKQMTPELLTMMHQAGCVGLFWGLESGSQKVIDLMQKNYSIEIAMRILDDCHRIGIQNYLPLIIGFPGETPADLAETAHLIDRYRDKAVFLEPNQCAVRPNSPLYERYMDYGLASNDYSEWAMKDKTNTPTIRASRLAIIKAVLKGRAFSRDSIIFELSAFNLNATIREVTDEIDAFLYAWQQTE